MNVAIEQSDWDPLVELMREEVQQYGGLYNLLDRQQDEIFGRDPDAVLQTNTDIENYMSGMGQLRENRESMVEGFANKFNIEKSMKLVEMLNYFPDYIRPLLKALADEINQMVTRTRRKARQNFMLLSRTLEINQEALATFQPEEYSKTYSRGGKVGVKGKARSTYKALV